MLDAAGFNDGATLEFDATAVEVAVVVVFREKAEDEDVDEPNGELAAEAGAPDNPNIEDDVVLTDDVVGMLPMFAAGELKLNPVEAAEDFNPKPSDVDPVVELSAVVVALVVVTV